MLVHTGKIAQDDVDEIMQIFNEYDIDGSGKIDIQDVSARTDITSSITPSLSLLTCCGCVERRRTEAEVVAAEVAARAVIPPSA